MRLLILSFWAVMCVSGQVCSPNVVCNIIFDGIGNSSGRVIFNFTGTIDANLRIRFRYGTSSTSGGTGGALQLPGTSVTTYRNYASAGVIGGLAPSTLYYVSPEVSTNAGSSYSTGAEATFTTLARTHPLPYPPVAVSTAYPAQTGMVLHVLSDCSNLQAMINAASLGDTIVVPMGTICSGGPYTLPNDPNMQSFTPAQFRTSDSTINKTGIGLIYTENQEVRVSTTGTPNGNCLPGMKFFVATGPNCDTAGGSQIRKGGKLYAHNVSADILQLLVAPSGAAAFPGWVKFTCDATADTITVTPVIETSRFGYAASPINSQIPANTTFQVRAAGALCPGLLPDTTYYWLTVRASTQNATVSTQISLSSGGPPVDIAGTGTGDQYIVDQGSGATHYITAARTQSDPWLLITTDGVLPAVGTPVSPSDDAQMFHIRRSFVLQGGNYNIQFGILTQNVRFEGMIQDTATNTEYLTTTDPQPYCGMINTKQDNRNIVFSHTRVQGPGYPNRFGCATAIFLNGSNIAVTDSDWRGMDYWHPWYSGFTPTVQSAGAVARLAAGSGFSGASIFGTTTTSANSNWTIAGSTSGTAYWYLAMDGSMEIRPPTGITGSCSTTGTTCTVLTPVASPAFPLDGNGRTAALKLATVTIVSGVVTAVTAADAFSSVNNLEGTSAILAGIGPGPYLFDKNFISGTGIPLHFDDSGGAFQIPSDITISGNTFDVPQTQMATGPISDKLRYGHRNTLECKSCQRVKIDTNKFIGSFSEISPASITVAMTAREGGYISDWDMVGNTFTGVGGTNIPQAHDSQNPVSRPSPRSRVYNNAFTLNAYQYYVIGLGSANPRGWIFTAGYGSEDILIDHNTAFDNRGSTPVFGYWTKTPSGGVKISNNFVFYSGDAVPFFGEDIQAGCGYQSNKTMFDCTFTNGPGVPGYTFAGNVIVPSWQTSATPTDIVADSTVTTAFGMLLSGGTNYLPSGVGEQAKLDTIKFITANLAGEYIGLDLRLQATSPYWKLGTDMLNIGWLGNAIASIRRRTAILIAALSLP